MQKFIQYAYKNKLFTLEYDTLMLCVPVQHQFIVKKQYIIAFSARFFGALIGGIIEVSVL